MVVNPLRAQPRDVAQPRAISSRIQPSRHRRSTARSRLARAVVAAAVVAVSCAARASTNLYWAGIDGNWDDLMWSNTPGGPPGLPPPGADQTASITFNDALTRTVTVSHADTIPPLKLTLDNTAGGLSLLSQMQGTMRLSAGVLIGAAGRGEYDISGGTLVSQDIFPTTLGRDATGDGTLRVSGDAGVMLSRGAVVGDLGRGSVIQAGGAVTVPAGVSLVLGNQAGGTGSYSLGGNGTLNSNGSLSVGLGGTGSFAQSGGVATITQMTVGGTSNASSGSVSLTGGQLAVSGAFAVNSGSFAQSGGTASFGGTVTIGTATTPATVSLTGGSFSAGALNLANGSVFHGSGMAATFGSMTLGSIPLANGVPAPSYTLSPGATLNVTGRLSVGTNTARGGALYVGEVALADGLDQIQHITGNGLNIYYNATDPANAYLGGQTYPLVNGGFLIGDAAGTGSVPEPGALGGMLIVAAAAGLRRRRRRRGA